MGATCGARWMPAQPLEGASDWVPDPLPCASWSRSLRLHQCVKNLIVFVPLILGGRLTDLAEAVNTVVAFVALTCIASGTYLINDVWDIAEDRKHWSKRYRPIAAGRLAVDARLCAPRWSCICAGVALGLPRVLEDRRRCFCSIWAITLAYTLHLKTVAFVDGLVLATLFTVRLGIGAVAADVPPSPWLFVFSMFLFASLSYAKRHTEIVKAIARQDKRVERPGLSPGRCADDAHGRHVDRDRRRHDHGALHRRGGVPEQLLRQHRLALGLPAAGVPVRGASLAAERPRRDERRSGGVRHQGSTSIALVGAAAALLRLRLARVTDGSDAPRAARARSPRGPLPGRRRDRRTGELAGALSGRAGAALLRRPAGRHRHRHDLRLPAVSRLGVSRARPDRLAGQVRDFILVNLTGQATMLGVAALARQLLISAEVGTLVAGASAHALGIAVGAVVNYLGHRHVTFAVADGGPLEKR